MFSLLRHETADLQVYGKLSLAKDYLRIGCATGGGRALREWLDRAYSGNAGEVASVLTTPARFLMPLSGAFVQGCAWPSSDAGGLRRFPFTVFVERKRGRLLSDLRGGLTRSATIWKQLAASYAAHRNYLDGQAFLTAMRGKTLRIDDLGPVEPAEVDLAGWTGALWPGRGAAGLDAMFAELERLRSDGHRGPVRLPIASGVCALAQVHAWWTVLVETGLLSRSRVPFALLPITSSVDEDASCVLAPATPAPQEAACLSLAPGTGLAGDPRATRRAPVGVSGPVPESAGSLADSLHGALVGFRARHACTGGPG